MKKEIQKKPAKKTAIRNASSEKGKLILWTAGLIILSFIVFSPALKNELVNWDDYNYIRDNPVIRSLSADNILHIFNYRTFIMGNYHPFTILTYALEYKIGGDSPFIYHINNILLHLVNVALLCWLVWLMTRKFYAALIASALFAIHPMRVESVVWAAERKDVLYTAFYLLSLILYIFYLTKEKDKWKFYAASLVLFLFSIFSKGQAVVLPLTFLLVDYWFGKKLTLRTMMDKVPFFALSLLFGFLAIQAQSSSLTADRLATYTFPERLVYASYNIPAYLYKLVFPFDLACFYGYPKADEMTFVYAIAALTPLLLALVFFLFRKNRVVLFGSLFFLFTIFIVIQLMPIGNAIIADRYTYIPYIGLFFIIGMLLNPLFEKPSKKWGFIRYLVYLLLAVFAVASFLQSKVWRNNVTLWSRVIEHNPREGMAYNNLGIVYLDRESFDTAIVYFNKAIENRENYLEVYRSFHNLGKAYSENGNPDIGIRYYNQALNIQPGFIDAIFGRGLTYTEMQKYDSSIADFTTILATISPTHAESYYSRAIAYNKKGMTDSAIADYTSAIRVRPDYAGAYTNRGNIWFNTGNADNAIADYTRSLEFDPSDGKTYLNRSFAYFRKNQYAAALADAEKARSLNWEVPAQYIADLRNLLSRGN